MKRKFIQICSFIGLLIGLTVAAQAQRVNQYKATIPFAFNVGNKTFAAGEYAFKLTNPLAYHETLTIRNLKSGATHVVLVRDNRADGSPQVSRLRFSRYEDRYFLAEITSAELSAKFLKSRVESRLAETRTVRREFVALNE